VADASLASFRLVTWLCRVTQNADGSAVEGAWATAEPRNEFFGENFLEMAARFREDDDETTSLSDLLKEQDIKL